MGGRAGATRHADPPLPSRPRPIPSDQPCAFIMRSAAGEGAGGAGGAEGPSGELQGGRGGAVGLTEGLEALFCTFWALGRLQPKNAPLKR